LQWMPAAPILVQALIRSCVAVLSPECRATGLQARRSLSDW
jgi:hypothetical protein